MVTYNVVTSGRGLEVVWFTPKLCWDAMTAARACTEKPKLMCPGLLFAISARVRCTSSGAGLA
jgi:hypothetical protein